MSDLEGLKGTGPFRFSPPLPFSANSTENEEEGGNFISERQPTNKELTQQVELDQIERCEGYESEEKARRTFARIQRRIAREAQTATGAMDGTIPKTQVLDRKKNRPQRQACNQSKTRSKPAVRGGRDRRAK